MTEPDEIPRFEGKQVHFAQAKVTNIGGVHMDDEVFAVDDTVRLVVDCRVVAVDHKVNEVSGKLGRYHLLKAVDSRVVPYEDA